MPSQLPAVDPEPDIALLAPSTIIGWFYMAVMVRIFFNGKHTLPIKTKLIAFNHVQMELGIYQTYFCLILTRKLGSHYILTAYLLHRVIRMLASFTETACLCSGVAREEPWMISTNYRCEKRVRHIHYINVPYDFLHADSTRCVSFFAASNRFDLCCTMEIDQFINLRPATSSFLSCWCCL